jgi:hypothetical protein
MKKWKAIFNWSFWLLFIVWAFFIFYIESTSVYWLVGKLILFAVLLLGPLLREILEKESKFTIISRICFIILFFCFFGYQQIAKYKSDRCDDHFGREFNARRRRLGTPEIPADWHVDYKGRGHVTWKAKDTIGHAVKYIDIDSSCAIKSEYDAYNLKTVKGKTRSISIDTRYAKRKGSDSISYRYDPGIDTGRWITRQQADSIFAAEKIKKDY